MSELRKKEFSPAEQRLLWECLAAYRLKRALSQNEICAQIEYHTGISVHDRTLRRLRDGQLRAASVSPFYQFVIGRIDENFDFTPPQTYLLPTDRISEEGGLRWERVNAVSSDFTRKVVDMMEEAGILVEDVPKIYAAKSTISEGYFFKFILLDLIPNKTLFFFLADGQISLVEGKFDDFVSDNKLKIDVSNPMLILLVLRDIFSSLRDFTIIYNNNDLTLAAKRIGSHFDESIDIKHPFAQIGDRKSNIQFDCLKKNELLRVNFQCTDDGKTSWTETRVCALEESQDIYSRNILPKYTKSRFKIDRHPNSEQILGEVFDFMSMSFTGCTLKHVCLLHSLQIDFFVSNSFSVSLHESQKSIIVFIGKDYKSEFLQMIFYISASIRMFEHRLLGFRKNPKSDSMFDYASFRHASTIDAICFAMKTVSELPEEHRKNMENVIRSLGFWKMYVAQLNGASTDEITDLYTNT